MAARPARFSVITLLQNHLGPILNLGLVTMTPSARRSLSGLDMQSAEFTATSATGRPSWLAFQNVVLEFLLHSLGQGVFIQEDKW
jgi:hypothetical protein